MNNKKKKFEFDRDEFFICLFLIVLILALSHWQTYLVGFAHGKYEDHDSVVFVKKNCKNSSYTLTKGGVK